MDFALYSVVAIGVAIIGALYAVASAAEKGYSAAGLFCLGLCAPPLIDGTATVQIDAPDGARRWIAKANVAPE